MSATPAGGPEGDPAPVPLQLDDPVSAVPGVPGKLATAMRRDLGLSTVHDLIEHPVRRYHDAGEVLDLSDVVVGEPATLIGTVEGWSQKQPRSRGSGKVLRIAEATVRQASGERFTATWFNQPWRVRQLTEGTVAAFSGKVKTFGRRIQLASPDVQVLGRASAYGAVPDDVSLLDRQQLLPVYPAVKAVPAFKLMQTIRQALAGLPVLDDWLPGGWLDELELLALDDAVRTYHAPPDRDSATAARRRLAFDELFAIQLGLQWRRAHLEAGTVGRDNFPVGPVGLAQRFLDALPFPPTGAQARAFEQIGFDLGQPRPMHRLLQGDVGSGKTIVAVWTLLNAVDHGRQGALMVPTEVLAEQHFRTLTSLLAPLGVNVLDGVRVELLTGSSTVAHRRRVLGGLLTGEVHLVVGTHALLEEGVRFDDLGVVVIDEQHRFGVSQRLQLKEKGATDPDGRDVLPDVLVMTATPIPRSLALTVYGDLDVTTLDELPPGREPIRTRLITPTQAHRRAKLYAFIRDEVRAGKRAFVICPLVEASEALAVTDVVTHHRHLATDVFPDLDVALVHGQMRSEDKEAAMEAFRSGAAQVLVSTTVIEVGVDVPEATVMIVEDAERFGISQLHQLRGRVGRGGGTSYCVLFAGWNGELTDDARRRLEAVAASTDGFALADTDLEIRGEGQLFGKAQSGLPDLKVARLQRDLELVAVARERAAAVVAADPDLTDHPRMLAELHRRYEGGLEAFAALQTG
ncbi:ATP-dependent DNA helicase RecG [Nitriliruptoraceae bacterium ZYF776]|nr:ATP-dependent DNA helicase RecG [Profundirhabdus halotolerans]